MSARDYMSRIFFAALLACALPLQASPGFIKLSTQVFQEQRVVGADGKAQLRRVPATNFHPGSDVIYEVGYSNAGTKPAQVIITNPLPEDFVYQSYAARAVGATLEVSMDQGISFVPLKSVSSDQFDGISHVRWKTVRAIQPGEAGAVSLRAKLK